MVEEKVVDSYSHRVCALLPEFLAKLKSITEKDPDFLDDNCRTCVKIHNGGAGGLKKLSKISMAATALKEIKQVARHMVAKSGASWSLNAAQLNYMRKIIAKIDRLEGKIEQTRDESIEDIVIGMKQRK